MICASGAVFSSSGEVLPPYLFLPSSGIMSILKKTSTKTHQRLNKNRSMPLHSISCSALRTVASKCLFNVWKIFSRFYLFFWWYEILKTTVGNALYWTIPMTCLRFLFFNLIENFKWKISGTTIFILCIFGITFFKYKNMFLEFKKNNISLGGSTVSSVGAGWGCGGFDS